MKEAKGLVNEKTVLIFRRCFGVPRNVVKYQYVRNIVKFVGPTIFRDPE